VGKKYVIFDLDGTLININSVTHHADAKDWEAFADATLDCPPFESMVEYARHIQQLKTIGLIVATAKPERLRARTLNWLSMQGIIPDALLMRPHKDFRPSAELKPALIQEFIGEDWKPQVLFAIEDRDKVVDAWRALGVPCLQCAPSLY
jgi:beta-phosphoglucomutase-like phosphatase (HAD superfamily)